MRVCMIYDADYPWDVRVEKILSTLGDYGCDVHLICRNLGKKPTDEYLNNIHFHRMPYFNHDGINSSLSFPAFFNPLWLLTILRVVKETSPNIIIVRDLPLTLSAVIIGRTYGIPVVFDMAENYPAMVRDIWRFEGIKLANLVVRNPFIVDAVEALCVKLVNSVLVVTEEAKSRLIARYHLDESRIHIVSNTPRLTDIYWTNSTDETPELAGAAKLIYIGGLQAGRSLEVVIRGIALCADKFDCSLTILGKGEGEPNLKKLVNRLNIREKVFFKGWVEHAVIGPFLSASDVGIVPHPATEHTNTTLPNKLFDYMAYAKPVLASDTKPVQRIIESEGCGLIYGHESPEDFQEKLRQLADPKIRAKMGANGRKAIEEKYNWEVDSRNLLAQVLPYLPLTLKGRGIATSLS